MALKRGQEDGEQQSAAKKAKHGFRVGPANLPDGPWKRKVTKIKQDIIHKAKIKKEYAKIKAEEEKKSKTQPNKAILELRKGEDGDHSTEDGPQQAQVSSEGVSSDEEQIHPTRQLMLKDEDMAQKGEAARSTDPTDAIEDEEGNVKRDDVRRRTRRPGYYDKQLKKAEEQKAAAEKRSEEFQRRREERERRLAERQKHSRAMAKTVGRDGKKKLGRESAILLDKVKRLVAKN